MNMLMNGKRGLVMGVANTTRSPGASQDAERAWRQLAFTYQGDAWPSASSRSPIRLARRS